MLVELQLSDKLFPNDRSGLHTVGGLAEGVILGVCVRVGVGVGGGVEPTDRVIVGVLVIVGVTEGV